jgi:hypothetical protein
LGGTLTDGHGPLEDEKGARLESSGGSWITFPLLDGFFYNEGAIFYPNKRDESHQFANAYAANPHNELLFFVT